MIDVTKFWTPSIDTTNALIAHAEKINALAASKNVQVSRWVNNSKGRQIVTYMVHTGARNQFASKQENVQFTVKFDAGHGGRVWAEQETDMMAQVAEYLSSIVTETEQVENVYEITFDGFEAYEPVTVGEAVSVINEWNDDEQFSYEVQVRGDELRVYASRRDGEFKDIRWTPSTYTDWREITNDSFYIILGEKAEVANV